MNKSQIAVLVVFANPRGTNSLLLGTEERAIRQSIRLSRYRDTISLTTCHASTIHDFRRALLENEFHIIHFSGHGSEMGLIMEDEQGGQYVVPDQALADLLIAYSPPLQCIILNACFSNSLGQLTLLGVPFTISMEKSITDEAAIEFSRGFYDAIGSGRGVEFAYEEGCRTVHLAIPNTEFVSHLQKSMTQFQCLSDEPQRCNLDSKTNKVYELYKNSVISDIQNNLILELYDRPRYEDICLTPLVSTKDEHGNPYKVLEAHKLVQLSRSVIMGEPGSGKTTTLRKLCMDLLNQVSAKVTPVYISLASYGSDYVQKKQRTFWDYINEEISIHGCPDAETLVSASGSDLFLLLDGWDEMTDDNAIREAKRFLAQTSLRFIITCRPEAQRTLPAVDRYEMHPLSHDRMREFIRLRIKEPDVVDRIMTWLDRHQSMLKLAENPLNLSIVTIVFLEKDGNIGKLTRTKLYERAFDAIIRQHHREHAYAERQIYEIERILQRMAYQTMAIGEGRFFTMRELDQAGVMVLGEIPSPEISNLLQGKLGIIRDRRSGRMEFFHLWYQEFLSAQFIITSCTDVIQELNNRKLASSFPYIIGLLPTSQESYNVMMNAAIHDPFNFCRAVPECDFTDQQIESILKRILQFAENTKPSIPVRVEMAQALARAGISSIPSLKNILQDRQNSDYFRRAVLEALVILPVEARDLDKLLLELLGTESLGLLWHVIEHIGKRRVTDGTALLHKYTKHTDPIVVGDALWALHEIEGNFSIALPDVEVDALLNCLSAEDLHIQGHALRTLGRLRVISAIPRLKQHLAHTKNGYRWIAPEAAALIGGKEALNLIELALNDSDPRVIAAALIALLEIDQEIQETIIENIQQYTDSTVWITSMAQPLGNVARTTIQKLRDRKVDDRLPSILLARHCMTKWNKEQKLQGTMDLPLSPEGVEEAKLMSMQLSNLGISRIVTSTYRRAYETAQIYSNYLGVGMEAHPGFRELDHGSWEGRSIPEMLSDPNCGYKDWLYDATRISIPDSAESIYMAQQRCIEALRNIILKHQSEVILIIMHKHIRAILQCSLKGLSLSNFGQQIDERLNPQKVPPYQIEHLYQIVKT